VKTLPAEKESYLHLMPQQAEWQHQDATAKQSIAF
jgi:hypothetical protein